MRFGSLIAVVALVAALFAACSSDSDNDSGSGGDDSGKTKVAFVYVGPVGDAGWTKKHDDGRKELIEALGDKIEVTYKESVPEGAKSEQTFEQLARDGYDLIFATSFGYGDAIFKVAKKYPDVKFEWATGYKTAKNMADYYGAGEDAIYLSGMAAGAATKTGVVGYVVPFAIPEVIRHTNAFALGVQATHPGATVKIVWTNSWFSPATEKKAAQSLKAAGADVIGQNVDSPAAGQYAESAGLPWVGYDSDAQKFAPKQWLTAAVYR